MRSVAVKGEVLRIFVSESQRHNGQPLYHVIVDRAREAQLYGATVLKPTLGFGTHRVLHTNLAFEVSLDMPILIEIIGTETAIDAFLPMLDDIITEGIVTREHVEVFRYHSEDSN
jgi:uncharacterized protein